MDQLFDFIKDYGGYAGAASVLGLAVLSLLYFAQAREVKRLREWAGRAPERAAEIEQRAITGQPATPRPQPAAVQRQPVRQPGQPQTAAAQQAAAKPPGANGAPAQPGAPATAVAAGAAGAAAAGATQTPGAQPGQPAKTGDDATKVAGSDAEKADGDAKPAEGEGEGEGAKAPAAGAGTPTPPAAPATPAPSAPATGATPQDTAESGVPIPPPRTPAARPRPQTTPAPRPAPAALRSGGAGTRQSRPANVPTQRAGRRFPVGLIAAIAAGVIVLGVVLALVLGGGGDDPKGTGGSEVPGTSEPAVTPPPNATNDTRAEPRPPSEVSVAVLNGTTITGLAGRTADKLRAADYNVPASSVTDAVERNRSATEIRYAEGYQAEARAVAKAIGAGNDIVEAGIDQNLRTVAGDDARVVVTVGSDQNEQSGQG